MKLDWAHLKTTVERCLNSAKKGERGGLRVHCGAAERMLKGARDTAAKELLGHVHKAKTAIEIDKSVEFLELALELVTKEAPAS